MRETKRAREGERGSERVRFSTQVRSKLEAGCPSDGRRSHILIDNSGLSSPSTTKEPLSDFLDG